MNRFMYFVTVTFLSLHSLTHVTSHILSLKQIGSNAQFIYMKHFWLMHAPGYPQYYLILYE